MKLTIEQEAEFLNYHEACEPAIEWIAGRSLATCWPICEKESWMLWLVVEVVEHGSELHRSLVRCTAEIARTVLDLVSQRDRPAAEAAIAAAIAWAESPTEETRIAAGAAAGASSFSLVAQVRSAAAAAAAVAAAAATAAGAAATTVLTMTAWAVTHDLVIRVRPSNHADIVRQHIAWEQIEAALVKKVMK